MDDGSRYYIRMRVHGVSYVLWRIRHEKLAQKMVPMWWKEDELGDSVPHLYRTQTWARSAIESYGDGHNEIELCVWDEEREYRAKVSP